MNTRFLLATALFVGSPFPSFGADPDAQTISITSFEADTDLAAANYNHADGQLTATGATIGAQALQVTFNPPASYPGVTFHPATPYDWHAGGGIAFDVTNPGAEPISFALRIDDAPNSDGSTHSRTGAGRVLPGKTVTYLMPFNADLNAGDMSGLAGYTLMRNTGPAPGTPFAPSHIVQFNIFVVKPAIPRVLIFDNMRLVPPVAPIALKPESKLLLSFEGSADAATPTGTNATAAVVDKTGATDGIKALKMEFQPAVYPCVVFKYAQPLDLRGYSGIQFDVTNPMAQPVAFYTRIDDGAGSRSGNSVIDPGVTKNFMIPFGVDPASVGMAGLPATGTAASVGSGGAGGFNIGHITEFQVFMVRPTENKALIVDNFRTVPGEKQDLTKLVDEYGQYTRQTWPGKVLAQADFVAQRVAEAADLKANPWPAAWDKYGGWAAGPTLKATGFFRTEKYKGKWSLVDPDGRLFFSTGITTVGPSAASNITGRDAMYTVAPATDPLLSKYIKHTTQIYSGPVREADAVNFYGANLERKYGVDSLSAWKAVTLSRLPSWGINTIGAFSTWDLNANGKVAYTCTIWPGGGHATIATGGGPLDDPYDPKFTDAVTAATTGQAAKAKDDPYCIGYFVSNEQPWGNGDTPTPSHYSVPLSTLKMALDKSPAKQALVEKLKAKYVDVAKLNTAWGTTLASWDDLSPSFKAKSTYTTDQQTDFSEFESAYALKYFSAVRDGLKKADPNHMYLGCKFAGRTPEIVKACAAVCDVVSFDTYTMGIDQKQWNIIDGVDAPILIGEFHFGALDRGMFQAGLIQVSSQTKRGEAYRNYVRSALDDPRFVGTHWFQYTDEPLLGRSMDGENGNIGFVSVTDTPYPELIAAARATANEMYVRRYSSK
ncbi:MAG TPA: beta-galactosidase [Capsulimonadaceae bacterium]|jgi:hypothetical protein